MKTLSIDIESFSSVDLTKSGVYKYAESDDFEILLFGYAVDGGAVKLVDLACREKIPAEIIFALTDETVKKTAFNAQFERICLSRFLRLPKGKYLNPNSWYCTMVWCATLGLPLSLEKVGEVLGLEKKKLSIGKNLINLFCKPCEPDLINGGKTRNFPNNYPERWAEFKEYNKRDVETEIEIQNKISVFPVLDSEWEHYHLDQLINDMGIALDMEFVEHAILCDETNTEKAEIKAKDITGVENPNSPAQLKAWLVEQGQTVNSLSKAEVSRLLKDATGNIEEILKLRQELAKSSVKKYTAMRNAVCPDNRARGLIQFYGANRTGRYCLTGDHEVLTDKGWQRLDEWNGGKIACWNPIGEKVSFQESKNLSFPYVGKMYIYDSKRICQCSTPDHKMYFKPRYDSNWQIDTVQNMANSSRPIIPFFGYRQLLSGMEHNFLRVLIMVQADGFFTNEGSIKLGFMKERKVERCKKLLRDADIIYSLVKYEQGGKIRYQFTIYARHVPLWLRLFQNKTFGMWLLDENADVFFDELVYWDGYRSAKNSIQYVTCNKQNADIVQAFAHISGRAAQMKIKKRSNYHKNWQNAYILDIWLTPKNNHEIKGKPEIVDLIGNVYCASTPTGFFMVRRNGIVWVTGNSGRLIQTQNCPQNHLKELSKARELVKADDYRAIENVYGNISNVLSELIRTAFVPMKGHRFIVSDFSAIEARIIAWYAGETWKLNAFENGEDIYCATASQMFQVPVEKHGENAELRQKGKIAELACIAKGQLVLTDKGLVPIENITRQHLLWDSENWVKHEGLIDRGEKEVITYEGLTATPDHLVYVKGESKPVRFEQAAASGAQLIQTIELQEKKLENNKRKVRVYDIRNAGPNHRFTVSGKLVHNCGYGGSVGALKAMGATAMGIKESELKSLVTAWRNANPNITKFWWAVDNATKYVVKTHKPYSCYGLTFSYEKGILFIELPSKRRLAYIRPRIGVNNFGSECVTYEGLGTTKKWERIESYGPKFVENIVQATARDILAETMQRLYKKGYRITMHVHDEVVLEVPMSVSSVEEVSKIMSITPAWAEGLKLSADGYECEFYKKE